MAAGPNAKTAIFDRGFVEAKPDGQDFGFVGFGQHHAVVLVDGRFAQLHAPIGILGRYFFGWFQAHMLHRVRVNLRPDQRFDGVEQLFVAQRVKDGRPHPHRRIRFDIRLGQRKVKILGLHLAAFAINFDQSIAKG